MGAPADDRAGIRQVIRALRAKGWVLNFVYDGEEEVHVSTEAEAIEAVMAVDEATLVVNEGTKTGPRGWVFFVLGNDPDEVVCDHTINLSGVLDPLFDTWMEDGS